MTYEAKNYDRLLGAEGFSDQLLKNHFSLYQGYVSNVNKLLESTAALVMDGKGTSSEYAEMKRRLGWEFDGMRLHEFYFENMIKGGVPHDEDSGLHGKMEKDFGSHENWEKDFRATAAIRGIGWAVLYYDRQADRLFNVWINEHDTGHFAGCQPILVFDAFEHAYMIDFGTKRADYIDSFMKSIDWGVVEERLN